MTITYPRDFPSSRMSRVMFEPDVQESIAPEQGGRFVSVQLGPMVWHAEFSTTPASEVEFSIWRAWLDSLDGAGRRFYGRDMRRPLPWNYRRTGFAGMTRAGGGAFDGTSATWSVNADRDVLTIETLPAGLNLVAGDYVGLKKGNSVRSLHRMLENLSADGSGVGAWTVRPTIDPSVPADATVQLVKPTCLMRIVKRDRTAEHKERTVSFEAMQDLVFA